MDYRQRFFVDPSRKLRLEHFDPNYKGEHKTAKAAKAETKHYLDKLAHQQALLYAERRHAVLVVLQAMDAGGKDGTINHVFTALNPQGTRVANFKEPTAIELAHDFLWRVHPHAPERGEVAIFNRSHYEDVLVTRIHKTIDAAACFARYERIRGFEAGLAEEGTTILKFFLNIGKEEQLERFAERFDDPRRNWKISEGDYRERQSWADYMAAYEDALAATSTQRSPWYVIPSNHKWFRNLAVSQIMADTIEELHISWPEPSVDLAEMRRRYHRAECRQRHGG